MKECSVIYKLRTDPRTFEPMLEPSRSFFTNPSENFLKSGLVGNPHSNPPQPPWWSMVVGEASFGAFSLAVYGSERRTLSYKYAVYTLYVDP